MARATFLLGALGLVAAALGDDTTEGSSQLLITGPASLLTDNIPIDVRDHRSALFGAADYGSKNALQARLAVLSEGDDDSFCPDIDDILKLTSDSKVPIVILLDGFRRCKFVTEAAMVAQAGGGGLLVMEDKCLESNQGKSDAFKKHCDGLQSGYIKELGYMSGNDNSIAIPSMLISHYRGRQLLECYKQSLGEDITSVTGVSCSKDHPIIVNMRWNIPQERTVSFDLWTSSLLDVDVFVREEWYELVMPELYKISSFTPRYFVWDGVALGCKLEAGTCKDACHNSGRYCHFDPDGLDQGSITGRDVSRENMRQACAFQQVQQSPKDQLKWWKYVGLIARDCTGQKKVYYTEECSKEKHKEAGLSFEETMDCITKYGGYEVDGGENALWESELDARNNMELDRLPTLIVNGKIVDFGASLKNVISAICAGIERSWQPDFCPCVTSLSSFDSEVLANTCFGGSSPPTPFSPSSDSSGSSFGSIFFTLVLLCCFGGAVLYAVLKRRESRMRSEVYEDMRNIMGEYMSMEPDDESPVRSNSFMARFSRSGASSSNNNNGDEPYQPVVELS
mmetsp:Transcript_15213/g.28011  ORF Transcript_15213/g.28011 Transcript_15213/m.28011 type:complete len:567 (-) Transcript_15213:57-1757(-)|eukprot:CAMPEP_0184545082 /NCGR_PEP_ID=MMETSP0199_2-20130426/4050_1 /TAXON_ID=1112570 /ORGANISM="Thraustochytrium sp., Strain LLF1b" /LENGTH=566 /DNA_ID=CAMNT_0026939339 /DNA_START=343 /DNA_END=2043 /DNA_ORIENTATION=+